MCFVRKIYTSCILVLCCFLVSTAMAAELRYHPAADRKFVYEYEVEAKLPNQSLVHQGMVWYATTSAGKNVGLKYNGQLHNYRGPVKDFRASREFAMRYNGVPDMRSQLTISPLGKMLVIEGSAPFPLFDFELADFPFELLPEKEQKSWAHRDERMFSMTQLARLGTGFFTNSSMFGGKRIAVDESASFELQASEGELLKYKKTHEIQSLDEEKTIAIQGKGTWTFNQKMGMPESLDFQYDITTKNNGATIVIPVTVKYRRLSEEHLAAMEQEKAKRLREERDRMVEWEEKNRRQHEEMMLAREEEMKRRKAPLTDEEQRDIIAALESGDSLRQKKALKMLSEKIDLKPNKEIAQSLKKLLAQKRSIYGDTIMQVLFKVSPEFKREYEISRAYKMGGNIQKDMLGDAPKADTVLPTGLVVAVKKQQNAWGVATIIRKLEHGEYQVAHSGGHGIYGNEKKDYHWADIRLAPPEVEQPYVDKKLLKELYPENKTPQTESDDPDSEGREFRTWTDSSGQFRIVAKYLKIEGSSVVLKKKEDGKEVQIPISRLSEKDRQIAKRLKEATVTKDSPSGNPFE